MLPGPRRSHRADTPEAGKVFFRLCPPELPRAYPIRRSTRRMVDNEPGPYRPRRAYPEEPAEPEAPQTPTAGSASPPAPSAPSDPFDEDAPKPLYRDEVAGTPSSSAETAATSSDGTRPPAQTTTHGSGVPPTAHRPRASRPRSSAGRGRERQERRPPGRAPCPGRGCDHHPAEDRDRITDAAKRGRGPRRRRAGSARPAEQDRTPDRRRGRRGHPGPGDRLHRPQPDPALRGPRRRAERSGHLQWAHHGHQQLATRSQSRARSSPMRP